CFSLRYSFWPISVVIVHPFVIFLLIFKTQMDRDCKFAFLCHHTVMITFDVYSNLLYQAYTLLPYPIICCTGIWCDERHSPRSLLTIMAMLTSSLCVPYLFLMLRMHQKMLYEGSSLRLTKRLQ
ncbi:hypothetical protein PFISCL1PPCAC_14443, partial [Pristionchus fissidentatus]